MSDISGILNKKENNKLFIKSQIVSLVSTFIDFTSAIIMANIFHVYYIWSNIIGNALGGITSFQLSRSWVFKKKKNLGKQMFRYMIISLFSIFFNTSGVYFIKETFDIPFILAKTIVAIVIAMFFNYTMNKHFVFK